MTGPKPRTHSVFKIKAGGRTRLVVFDTQDLSVGRAPENDVVVDDPEMSRRHAIFRRSPQGCRVEDQGTSNGTIVNGEPVAFADLKHGDVVVIGEVEVTYAETPRNPASLGPSVEYASQLKGFGGALAAGDGESTILGLGVAAGGDDDEPFEIRPAGEFDFGLHDEASDAAAPRDLDAELADLGDGDDAELADLGDGDLQFDLDPAPPASADERTRPAASRPAAVSATAPQRPAPVSTTAPPARTADDEAWVLDDEPASQPEGGPLAITLEIDGLDGELRRSVEGLIGKVLRVPGLRVRIKGGDLA